MRFSPEWLAQQEVLFREFHGLDLLRPDTRHAIGWCDKCGEWRYVPSRTTKDGSAVNAGRCKLTYRCPGTTWAPPIPRRPKRNGS